jgi:hypothetical protein
MKGNQMGRKILILKESEERRHSLMISHIIWSIKRKIEKCKESRSKKQSLPQQQ